MRALPALLILAACGGDPAASPGGTAAAATTAPAKAPEKAAPEKLADVGPDGPSDIAVPEFTVASDAETLAKGQAAFDAAGCGGCHTFGSKVVGPDLNGIGERRSPAWIARMIHDPDAMTKRDPQAKKMFGELMVQMPNQGVADDQLGPLVSFLVSHPSASK